jgi:hypothetical protein
MKTINVTLSNGQTRQMWQDKLQKVYTDFAEFEDYCRNYGLLIRLGFKSAAVAWKKNPTIRGSVYPSDFTVVK